MYTHITLLVAGFLAAILWMDLTFDVQVIPHLTNGEIPEDIIELNRDYYRRITVDSFPMSGLVAMVMCIGIAANLVRLIRSGERPWRRVASLVLLAAPSLWAMIVIFPDAQRLANEPLDAAAQSRLAIRIFYGHAFCLACILGLMAVQVRLPSASRVESAGGLPEQ